MCTGANRNEESDLNMNTKSYDGQGAANRLKKDTIFYLPAKFVPALFNVIVLPIYTRIFTPDDFGEYALVITGTSLCAEASSEWLRASVLRFYAEYRKEGRITTLYSTIIISLVLCLITVASVGLAIISFFRNMSNTQILALAQVGILVFIMISIFNVLASALRVSLRPLQYSIIFVLFSVGKITIALAAIFLLHRGTDGILWGTIFAAMICTFLLFLITPDLRTCRLRRFSFPTFRNLLRYGSPFSVSMLAFWVFTFSDRYLIGIIRDSQEVGLYSVSFTIAQQSLTLIFSVLLLAAYPLIVESWEHLGKKAAQRLITDATRIYFILCVPIIVILSLMSEPIIRIFTGERYWSGHTILPMIAISTFFFGLTLYVNKSFELSKKSHVIAIIVVASALINIGLNLLLISRYGYVGASVASVIAALALFCISKKIANSYLRWIPALHSLKNVLIVAVGMAIMILIMKRFIVFNVTSTLVAIFAAGCFYVAGLMFLREISVKSIWQMLSFQDWKEAR